MRLLRNGLNGASAKERLALLNVERFCESQAVQSCYARRLEEEESVLLDLGDVKPIITRIKWFRNKGKLLVLCKVYLTGADFSAEYKFRVDVSQRANLELERQTFRSRHEWGS